MRLNFSPSLQINNLFQSYQINRSAANKAGVSTTESSEEARRDTFTLSARGKTMDLINSLMKQKMDITDRKNSLIASTIEKGSSMETIKSQLEAYDEQLENIDITYIARKSHNVGHMFILKFFPRLGLFI